MKQLGLPTIAHPQPYTIGWLHQGRDLRVSQQCCLPYNIKPFMDEVLCDIAPLDVLLGQPYLLKRHAIYESRPRAIIVTLGNKLYRIPEVASPTAISLVTTKQCSKLISKTEKFIFLMGVHVDLPKIQVIQDWPSPTTMTELHNFLDLANFYRRFVLGFSHITWPLSQVTKGGAKAKFFWSASQQKAFIELKDRLCTTPVLALPDLQ
eukprot:PITA_26499